MTSTNWAVIVSFKNYASTIFRGPGMALISDNVGIGKTHSVLHSSPYDLWMCQPFEVSHGSNANLLLFYAVLCVCLSAGSLAVSGMIVRWVGVWIEGAWWSTNPYRSMRDSCVCHVLPEYTAAAGNATSGHMMTPPRWVTLSLSHLAVTWRFY